MVDVLETSLQNGKARYHSQVQSWEATLLGLELKCFVNHFATSESQYNQTVAYIYAVGFFVAYALRNIPM